MASQCTRFLAAIFCVGSFSVECAVCCLARNTYLIRAGLTLQLTPLLSVVSTRWFIFHCACLAGYRTGFFFVFVLSRGFYGSHCGAVSNSITEACEVVWRGLALSAGCWHTPPPPWSTCAELKPSRRHELGHHRLGD
jgi:hypothetical protein